MSEKIHLGTCGWSCDDWRGSFYPDQLPQERRLEFYAQHFNAVEVDSSFYAVPTHQTVEQWRERTPDGFRFCCKLPRAITHERRLRDSGDLLREFLKRVERLGEKLGPVLVQLSPTFKPGRDEEALRAFIAQLPEWPRFAVEFRDDAWHAPRIDQMLARHSMSHAWNDITPLEEQAGAAFGFLPETSDLRYIRLLGDLSTKYRADGTTTLRYGSLMWPRDEGLKNWALKIHRNVQAGADVYVFCANHFEGSAPLSAIRLAQRLGISSKTPGIAASMPGEQMDLF
ncbi:MAG TPA: DUF72 domain-containing protein [Chthoniobacterales bacterium]